MEDINTVFFVLLVLSVMALIASVHALQVETTALERSSASVWVR
jgi:hypothetical protein